MLAVKMVTVQEEGIAGNQQVYWPFPNEYTDCNVLMMNTYSIFGQRSLPVLLD